MIKLKGVDITWGQSFRHSRPVSKLEIAAGVR